NGLGNLDDLIAEYPDACVRNTQSYDQGFPYALPTGAVMFGLGDKDEVDLNEVTVRKISIGSEVFSDWEQ
ncbi:MAG TPA: hypothetical protein VM432_06275, partial [Bdellovibrionales bacterium]|nr:hypothetical protein [Bdellovibrionales bacterium]